MTAPRPSRLFPRRDALQSLSTLAALTAVGALNGCAPSPGGQDGPTEEDGLAAFQWLGSDAAVESITPSAQATAAGVPACDTMSSTMLRTQLQEDGGANALACPVGLALALALLHAGATTVGTGVNAALGVDTGSDPEARDRLWGAIQRTLQRFDVEDPEQLRGFDPSALPDEPLLHVADNIVVIGDDTMDVRQEYLDAVKRWYGATIARVPQQRASAALDAWADLHTGGLIKKSGIDTASMAGVVIQNALLLAARWATPFKAEDTEEDGRFTLADGSSTTTALMHGEGSYVMAEGQGWRALRLPYSTGKGVRSATDGDLAMDLVLPDAVGSPADMAPTTWGEATAALTAASSGRADGAAVQEVRVALPKLDLTSGATNLTPALTALGVPLDQLVLDHIAPGLSVNRAVQQVRLIVDEEGTAAAALTEIGIVSAPAPGDEPATFIVDRPYVLRIVDLSSGVVLIEAAVLNPAPA